MSGASGPTGEGWAEELIDELLPEELEWRRLTRRYPSAAVGFAAASGFALAWARGPALVGALSGMVTSRIARNVESVLADAAPD